MAMAGRRDAAILLALAVVFAVIAVLQNGNGIAVGALVWSIIFAGAGVYALRNRSA